MRMKTTTNYQAEIRDSFEITAVKTKPDEGAIFMKCGAASIGLFEAYETRLLIKVLTEIADEIWPEPKKQVMR